MPCATSSESRAGPEFAETVLPGALRALLAAAQFVTVGVSLRPPCRRESAPLRGDRHGRRDCRNVSGAHRLRRRAGPRRGSRRLRARGAGGAWTLGFSKYRAGDLRAAAGAEARLTEPPTIRSTRAPTRR